MFLKRDDIPNSESIRMAKNRLTSQFALFFYLKTEFADSGILILFDLSNSKTQTAQNCNDLNSIHGPPLRLSVKNRSIVH